VEQGAAIFVSPQGDNMSVGSAEAPVKTLGRALVLARAANLPVIACAGTYAESVALTGKAGVRVYGGFDCEDGWVLGTGVERSVIEPEKGVPLMVSAVSGEVVVEGFEFRAPAAASAGGSSVAVVVVDSPEVRLRESKLIGGDGADGASAAKPEPFPSRAKNGNAALGVAGGARQTSCGCAGTEGGQGGDGDPDGTTGPEVASGGDDGAPNLGGGKGGIAGQGCGAAPPGAGQDGASADEQKALGAGAREHGSWTGTAFMPAPGSAGPNGTVGQGGGGGRGGEAAGSTEPGGGGGGGGCGGCGGQGGAAGGGGGASIALIAIDSGVTLEDAELVTGKAGNGGAGAPGQEGQGGGFGGDQETGACPGGSGGKGSNGAPGGGGAGGLSVGVLYRGAEPAQERVRFVLGEAGSGGLGGAAASAEDDGLKGEAEERWELL
jgi:hypothetical protein